MQKLNFSYVETQFLQQSLAILTECRKTLMYSYALGHLLPSYAKQLEFLERDIDQEDQRGNNSLQLLSQKVKDKAALCAQAQIGVGGAVFGEH
uniref:Uncharacterized protein n=1 Tax=Ditylenchus dipsaci TaxID=166011 RepID=A0A915E0P8_9BILA